VSEYLLDTNILIALINQTDNRLPRRLRELISRPNFQPAVSVVSAWEISIKAAAGKIRMLTPVRETGLAIIGFGFPLLPMTIDHALEVAHPEPATKDPFDRLLLAVCACEGMKLVTTDEKLEGHRLVY
jgi:PIN domain nuclease of toxin-antitoxin system